MTLIGFATLYLMIGMICSALLMQQKRYMGEDQPHTWGFIMVTFLWPVFLRFKRKKGN